MQQTDLECPPGDRENGFHAYRHACAAAAAGLRGVLAWQIGRASLRLSNSGLMAFIFGRLIVGEKAGAWSIAAAALAIVAAALAGLMAERTQSIAETQVSVALRDAAVTRMQGMSASDLRSLSAGRMTLGLQRHPESVAALVIGHRSAGMMMAIGPLLAAAALAIVSWQAALLVVVLTPVMIIFFALVGETIRKHAKEQEKALAHVAGQFADRVRTLPTILANDGFPTEEAKLARRLDSYGQNTMAMLRIAFLNAGAIDFFSSLSIAMLAVFLGLGHLKLVTIPGFSNLELWQSLFILMVAPEYYSWFRRFSEQYHAKAEGLAALAALDNLLSAHVATGPRLPAVEQALAKIALPLHGLVVVAGPSGAGKSTLLRRLAGIEGGPPYAAVRSRVANCVWVATDSFVPDGSLAEALIRDITPPPCPTRLRHIAMRIGLLNDDLLPGGLAARIINGGANLSGGQRLRIALARALAAQRTVIADEPTAKLDSRTAAAVRRALCDMALKRLIIVATHDQELIALADCKIDLSRAASLEVAA